MFVIHRVLTKGPRAGIGLGLGLVEGRIAEERAARMTILRIDDMLHSDKLLVNSCGTKSNDAMAFLRTAFLLIAPTAPRDDAPAEEHKKHQRCLQEQARLFDVKTRYSQRHLNEMAWVRCDILSGEGQELKPELKLIQKYK